MVQSSVTSVLGVGRGSQRQEGGAGARRLLQGAVGHSGSRLIRRGDSARMQERRGAAAAGGGADDLRLRTRVRCLCPHVQNPRVHSTYYSSLGFEAH